MVISGIYKIENMINHHIYIGKAKDILHRWSEHKSDARRNKDNCPIHVALRKYGEDNFDFCILERMTPEEYQLHSNERERFWIAFFDTYNNKEHYNLTPGGDGGYNKKLTEEQKQKISKGLKKYYKTKKGKQKAKEHSNFMKQNPSLPHNPHTEEWKQNHSKKMSGQNNPNYGKHTQGNKCKCIETGKIYESTRQAAQEIGVSHTGIGRACRGIQKTAGGYHWEYI